MQLQNANFIVAKVDKILLPARIKKDFLLPVA
jgi:hypothetical protein